MLSRANRKSVTPVASDRDMGQGSRGDEPAERGGLLPDPPPIDPNIQYALAYLLQALSMPMAGKPYSIVDREVGQNQAQNRMVARKVEGHARPRRRKRTLPKA